MEDHRRFRLVMMRQMAEGWGEGESVGMVEWGGSWDKWKLTFEVFGFWLQK